MVFKHPKTTNVNPRLQRSPQYPRKTLTEWLKDEPKGPNGSEKVDSVFSPMGGDYGSSWTIDYQQAFDFAFGTGKGDASKKQPKIGTYQVLLAAQTDNNKMLMNPGPGGIYDSGEFQPFEYEQEVIGLGPINITKVMYMKV